jgi:hypothetical protein
VPGGVFNAGGGDALGRRPRRGYLGWRKEKASWYSVGLVRPVGRNPTGLARQGRGRWVATTWAELNEGIRNWFSSNFCS